MNFLTAENIHLRPLEVEDAAAFLPWVNDYEAMKTMASYAPYTLAEEKKHLENLLSKKDAVNFGIELNSGSLIGSTGFNSIDHQSRTCQFAILIGDKRQWGKGYGRQATQLMANYAFNFLNLNRISLYVREDNESAIKVYNHVGFIVEGKLRQCMYREGKYWGAYLMSLLKEDWK